MGKRVLVVDDDGAIRKAFALALEGRDYEVVGAPTGEEGLRMAKEKPCDLIILDLKMPGMNGIEVLRELRKDDPRVPVYIVTTFHDDFLDELKQVEAEGIPFEIARKPMGSTEIGLIVESVLG